MTYNKSEIMKTAWTLHKAAKANAFGKRLVNGKFVPMSDTIKFADSLKRAWSLAKNSPERIKAKNKAAYEAMTTAQKLEWVENKLFHAAMDSTYAVRPWNRDAAYSHVKNQAYIGKLEAERARLLGLLAA